LYTDTAYWSIGDTAAYGGNLWGGNKTSNFVHVHTNGSERIRINSDGQLLINRTTSITTGVASKLCITGNIDIDGNPGSTNVIRMHQSATEMGQIYGHTTGLRFYNFTGGVTSIKAQADATLRLIPGAGGNDAQIQLTGNAENIATEGFEIWYDNDVGDVHLNTTYNASAAAIRFHTRVGAAKSTANERLTIAGAGNVGIGDPSPETPLHIRTTNKLGSTFTGSTRGEGITVEQTNYTNGNYISLIEAPYDNGGIPVVRIGAKFTGSGSEIIMGTSLNYSTGITNDALKIDHLGNVLIGQSSTTRRLDVTGVAGNHAAGFYRPDTSGYVVVVRSNTGGTNTINLRIASAGDVQNTNNSYGAISDVSLKSNITDANSQLQDIMNVRVRSYTLNSTGETHLGVIAQELEEAGMGGLVEIDAEDNLKSVKYSILYMKAIKALQEAVIRIEALEAAQANTA
jgi:hypothetical protein